MFSGLRKVLGAHAAAVATIALIQYVTGKPPKFASEQEEAEEL